MDDVALTRYVLFLFFIISLKLFIYYHYLFTLISHTFRQ